MLIKAGRQPWIDFCRGLAMIAVVVDHTCDLFPDAVGPHTIFSVAMFTFLGGVCSCMSVQRRTVPVLPYIVQRVKPILIPYAIAVAVFRIYNDNFVLSFPNYLVSLVHFNRPRAFYFLLFYLQLVVVSPLLYQFVKRCDGVFKQVLLVAGTVLLSEVFVEHTYIMDSYGGGKYVLGGTYFTVFVLGMMFTKYIEVLTSAPRYLLVLLLLALPSLIVFEYFGFIYKAWSNPPNVYAILYTLLIMTIFFSLFHLVEISRLPVLGWISMCIVLIGKWSLVIFLYHILIKRIVGKCSQVWCPGVENEVVFAFVLLPLMIFVPIAVSQLIRYFRGWIESPEPADAPLARSDSLPDVPRQTS
ncbi:MAG: acyltransferase [Syntrophobacter sp.]